MNDIDKLARGLAKARKRRIHSTHVTPQDIKTTKNDLLRRFGTARLPSLNQRIAVAPRNPKIAALFFDFVWSVPAFSTDLGEVPEDIGAYGATLVEIAAAAIMDSFTDRPDEEMWAFANDMKRMNFGQSVFRFVNPARAIAEALTRETGIAATPVFANTASFTEQYRPGKREVLLLSLAEIDLVDDDTLTWEQVREIRNDKDAQRDIRQLFYWLDREMVDKAPDYIAAALDERLRSYRAALSKHGVLTVAGVLECLIDPKLITTAAVLATGGGLLGQAVAGAVGAVALTVGRITCSIVRNYVDLIDVRNNHADIAFIHELSKQLTHS